MNVSSFMFGIGFGVGYRIVRWLDVYAAGSWLVPLVLHLDEGLASGSDLSPATYTGVEGLEAALGIELRMTDLLADFVEADYRLTEYASFSYPDHAPMPTDYFGTSGRHGKAGVLLIFEE
ncbi:MAG: hypothetical protein ACOC0E_08435 [Spirochaetota bacterium]